MPLYQGREIICTLFWMSEIFVIANILKRFEDQIEFETHCESTMAQAHEEDIIMLIVYFRGPHHKNYIGMLNSQNTQSPNLEIGPFNDQDLDPHNS